MVCKKLDPRVHAALNCAAVSCPVLLNKAMSEANVDQTLETIFTNWLGENYQFKKDGSTFYINKIIKWYYEDFAAYNGQAGWTGCDGKKYKKGTETTFATT